MAQIQDLNLTCLQRKNNNWLRIGYGKTQAQILEIVEEGLPRKGKTLRNTLLMVGSGGKTKKKREEEVKARKALERAKNLPQKKSKESKPLVLLY